MFKHIRLLAECLDILRVIPRALMGAYVYLMVFVVDWFTSLPDPTNQQAALVTTVIGAGAGFFGLYVNSGPKLQEHNNNPKDTRPEWRN